MYKKIVTYIMVGVLSLTALSGCSSPNKRTQPSSPTSSRVELVSASGDETVTKSVNNIIEWIEDFNASASSDISIQNYQIIKRSNSEYYVVHGENGSDKIVIRVDDAGCIVMATPVSGTPNDKLSFIRNTIGVVWKYSYVSQNVDYQQQCIDDQVSSIASIVSEYINTYEQNKLDTSLPSVSDFEDEASKLQEELEKYKSYILDSTDK